MGFEFSRIARLIVGVGLAALLAPNQALAEDRAVVIGIDDYGVLGSEHSLRHAVSDAGRFRDFLIENWDFAPDQITLLTNAEASSGAIMDTIIERLISETSAGDRAVLYFAGLGSRVKGGTDETDDATEVILAHDADEFLGKMPEDIFADMLDLLESREVTVLFDTSYRSTKLFDADAPSGARVRAVALADTTGENRGNVSKTPQSVARETFDERPFGAGQSERAIWAAAAPSQYGWEDGSGGVLTTTFIDAISTGVADANGNGTITNAELLDYLNGKMPAWCEATPDCTDSGVGLLPHFAGRLTGIIGRPAPKPTEILNSSIAASTEADGIAESEVLGPTLSADAMSGVSAQVPGADADDPQAAMLGILTDLFTPSNNAELKIRIDGDTPLKIGESVQFQLRAERSGTLVLLDINPKGELAQVFPSSLAPTGATRMETGKILTIPSAVSANGLPLEIRVTEPAGKGFLLALFVEDDLPTLEALLPENISGGPISNAAGYLYEIAQDLLALQAGEDGNSAVAWSAVYLPYEIMP